MLNTVAEQKKVTVANGAIAQTVKCDPNATTHVFAIERGTATAGTVAVTAKAFEDFTAEIVTDDLGAAITVSLGSAGASSYQINGRNLHSIIFDATGEDGTWYYQYSGS